MSDFDEKNISEDVTQTDDVKEEITEERKNTEEDKVNQEDKSEYEDVCFICRRPESKTGKMFKLPNHISVCNDCMHKTMDTVSQFDYQIGRAHV